MSEGPPWEGDVRAEGREIQIWTGSHWLSLMTVPKGISPTLVVRLVCTPSFLHDQILRDEVAKLKAEKGQ